MGKVTTPKYVLEIGGFINFAQTPTAWSGRIPTVAKLEREVMAQVVSTMPGFVNETVGLTYGLQIPSFARIRENFPGGRVMVEWKAPMFLTMPNPADYPEVKTMESFWKDMEGYVAPTELERRKSDYALKLAVQITKNAAARSNS